MSSQPNPNDELRELIKFRLRSYADAGTYVEEKNIADIMQSFDAHLEAAKREAVIKSRDKLLSKLERTYTRIVPPIKESPMELTEEAIQYNRFVEDLGKFIDIERKKNDSLANLSDKQEQGKH